MELKEWCRSSSLGEYPRMWHTWKVGASWWGRHCTLIFHREEPPLYSLIRKLQLIPGDRMPCVCSVYLQSHGFLNNTCGTQRLTMAVRAQTLSQLRYCSAPVVSTFARALPVRKKKRWQNSWKVSVAPILDSLRQRFSSVFANKGIVPYSTGG